MHLLHKLRLLLVFYRQWIWVNGCTTVLGLYLYSDYLTLANNAFVFIPAWVIWTKMCGYGLIIYSARRFRSNELYLYYNQGIPARLLFVGVFTVDILVLYLTLGLFYVITRI